MSASPSPSRRSWCCSRAGSARPRLRGCSAPSSDAASAWRLPTRLLPPCSAPITAIELERTLPGKSVTKDFNLNKVAQLRGVEGLNVNELANSLKPVVLPGEIMRVFILKEGKEYNQGVAYLDDGTMVVVDNARRLISKTIEIVVTSVLQTTAGKMIFGRYIEAGAPAAAAPARAPAAVVAHVPAAQPQQT